ncbi:MAG: acyl carrier protein [Prevotella sp.]|jgi:acyl carrier protein|uniref:phosphopantetheine-binding protein n=2 Tax=Prevotellaceae TaxID=171552 RepID=UPI000448DA66|nr:phosphopantetheine-binding protein [Prevotella melaninogenica]ETT01723.1 putative acyl carrier protein [Prevotella sp. ICM33]MBF1581346.1 acyl carrier protein [Prevotella sp.]MBF1594303.1 acyl carrier protein [Prevotella sp.]MBW4895260.1 acyl carrier protein [Prevotella melaninogenica]QUB57277.1 acyl carrier protein [Prevotella melaninogenica]
MEELIKELKEEIIKALNLEEMTPEDIDEHEALFGDGLGLDSIDALELIVLLEKKYGIKLDNPAEGKKIFTNVVAIADYVSKNRKK